MSMKEEKLKEAAKLNQLKYVFDDTLDNAKINELKTIGIGNFIDGANWAINKACEWLKFNYTEFLNSSRLGIDIDEMIKDFKMDMKEE